MLSDRLEEFLDLFVARFRDAVAPAFLSTPGLLGANSYSWHKFETFPSLVMRDVLVTMIQ